MDIKQLEIFIAAAKLGSFSKVARQLFVSQSALSQRIRNLEEELGVRLFARDYGGVRLTEAGSVFLDHALQAVAILREGQARIGAEEGRRKLRIGLMANLDEPMLMEISFAFREQYPGVDLQIVPVMPPEHLGGLERKEFDIAEGYWSPQLEARGIGFLPLVSYAHYCCVPPEHPLAERRKLSLGELAGFHVALPQEAAGTPIWEALAHTPGVRLHGTRYDSSIQFNCCLQNWIMITFARYAFGYAPLKPIPLEAGAATEVEAGLVYPKAPPPAARDFLNTARQLFAAKSPGGPAG